MIKSFRAGGKSYNVVSWKCKIDGREGCACCEPKNAIHPSAIFRPGIREFVIPHETVKTRVFPFRTRTAYDGAAKSKRKR